MDSMDRPELIHTRPGMTDEDFFKAISTTGGWPEGYKYVSFYHAADYPGRYCKFTMLPLHTGWWTTIASADEYYWWKLTPERKAQATDDARKQLISQLR